jgi:hypothetical protein
MIIRKHASISPQATEDNNAYKENPMSVKVSEQNSVVRILDGNILSGLFVLKRDLLGVS